jgi:hypothetical protein
MTEHTPGPWRYEDWTFDRATSRIVVGPARMGNGKSPVATIIGHANKTRKGEARGSVTPTEQEFADARLCAAAPNLLAALQRLNVSYYPFTEGKGESQMEAQFRWVAEQGNAHEAARTAIAKATGESQ